MPAGRPPELFSDEEVIELGKDLVSWLEGDGKEEFMFEDWYFKKHNMFRSDWKSLIQRLKFLPYYEIARKKITTNMVKNKDIAQSYGNRYLGLYDNDVRDHEKEIAKEKNEAEKKSDITETAALMITNLTNELAKARTEIADLKKAPKANDSVSSPI